MNSLPRIRSGLLRHSLDKQVLVYDSRDDRVHLLDPTTACVLELLEEGGWTVEGIRAELVERLNVADDPALVWLAVDSLRAADLLDKQAPQPAPIVDVTRRDLVKKLAMTGAAAMLVPAIATLTATTGYAQGTLLGVGSPCGGGSQCLSGFCCNGTCSATNCLGTIGSSCSSATECQSGRCCGGACVSATCTANGNNCSPQGANCDCCSGLCHTNNKCTS